MKGARFEAMDYASSDINLCMNPARLRVSMRRLNPCEPHGMWDSRTWKIITHGVFNIILFCQANAAGVPTPLYD